MGLETAVPQLDREPEAFRALRKTRGPRDNECALVSVVIPAYRCAQYIAQAVDSVLNQSFTSREIIVVNDGSPDTAELEAALAPYVGRIRYFKQGSKGPSGARNAGIRNAFGRYVAFLDGDDYWTPDHLAKAVRIFEQDPGLALVYCDCILVRNGKPYSRVFYTQDQPGTVTFESLLLQNSTISTSSVVVAREAILAVGGFDEGIRRCEDFDAWLRLAFSKMRLAYHADAEVYHRMHDVSLSADGAAMIADRVRVYRKTAALSVSKEQRQIIRKMIAQSQTDAYVGKLKEALDRHDYAEARQAADSANALEGNWKIRLSMVGLRVAPGLFRTLHRARAAILDRRAASKRRALEQLSKSVS